MKKLILTTFLMISCVLVNAQVKQITGTVVDKAGEPVIGASVIEQNVTPTNGTITAVDGTFSLQVKENAVLSVSAIGYKTTEVSAQGKALLPLLSLTITNFSMRLSSWVTVFRKRSI